MSTRPTTEELGRALGKAEPGLQAYVRSQLAICGPLKQMHEAMKAYFKANSERESKDGKHNSEDEGRDDA